MREMSHLRRVVAALFVLVSLICGRAVAQQPTAGKLARDVYYLADDQREGRGIGTRGLNEAADYIAARFKSFGLRTLPGCDEFFQPFTMNAVAAIDPKTNLQIDGSTLELSKAFRPLGFSPDASFSAPVAFAGYGAINKEHQYDDYAGIDVKGKAVLVLRFEPHKQDGTSRFAEDQWSPSASLYSKADAAAAHGAVALLLVNPPRHHEPDQLLPVGYGGGKSKIPFIQITQQVANDLLAKGGSAKNLGALQAAIDAAGKPESFDLKDVTISGKVAIERKKVPVKNVVAYLPGGKHPDEYVVVGAHYDHLGHGGPGSLAPSLDAIHNGADDNASGTAAAMSLAEKLVFAGRRDRSIIFICFTGEEEGLIGSQYFVDHPPVELSRIVAMLNLDMVGRVRNEVLYDGGGGTAESFQSILNGADKDSPLQLKSIGKGGRGPSDHQSFAMKNIPVIFFFSGLQSDYHRPTDDADKINYPGMVEVVNLAYEVVDHLASMSRQQYVSTFDSQPSALSGVGSRGARVTLGVVPDYGTDESTVGVRITGTSPGSPAAAAGLKDGDVIVQIGARKIENLYDLTDFLATANPGDHVTIIVERDHQQVPIQATLRERRMAG